MVQGASGPYTTTDTRLYFYKARQYLAGNIRTSTTQALGERLRSLEVFDYDKHYFSLNFFLQLSLLSVSM